MARHDDDADDDDDDGCLQISSDAKYFSSLVQSTVIEDQLLL